MKCINKHPVLVLILFLVTAICVFPLGCIAPHKVQTAAGPVAVSDAARLAATLATNLQALEGVNESVYSAKLITPNETIAISRSIDAATRLNDKFVERVRAARNGAQNSAEIAGLFSDVAASLDDLNQRTLLGVKNPQARARLAAAFQLVQAAAQAVEQVIGVTPYPAGPGAPAGLVALGAVGAFALPAKPRRRVPARVQLARRIDEVPEALRPAVTHTLLMIEAVAIISRRTQQENKELRAKVAELEARQSSQRKSAHGA